MKFLKKSYLQIHRKITQKQIITKMEEELERRVNERRQLFDEIQRLVCFFKSLFEHEFITENLLKNIF